MTLEQALTISGTRTVDLWKLCREQVVAGHLQYLDSPDSLREDALDIVTEEVKRLRAELAAAHAALTNKETV